MLPEDVVAQDVPTSDQERIATQRAAAPITMDRIEPRRQRLAKRFSCQVPSASFFQESLVADEDTIGHAAVLARHARDREESARVHDDLDLEGRNFTSWPTNGTWPALRMSSRNMSALVHTRKRMERRVLEMQCRTPKGLARYVLKQHYKKAWELAFDTDAVQCAMADSLPSAKDCDATPLNMKAQQVPEVLTATEQTLATKGRLSNHGLRRLMPNSTEVSHE